MRDAINQPGRQMWYSITQQLDYNDGQDSMHCIKPSAPGKGRYGVRRTALPSTTCKHELISY